MDEKELDFILKQGEGQFIEFKTAFDKSISKEIVAFANSSGGRIFLGITDKGIIEGIKATNILKSQIHDTARRCDPKIGITLEQFATILIVNVPEGNNKPYSCSYGFYIRNGPNSQKLTRDEILEFAIEEGRVSFDEQKNSRFEFPKDFDRRKLNNYLKMSGLTKNLPLKETLLNLKVAVMEKEKFQFNNAGVLLFAKKPEKFFFTSKVVCATYQTNEKVNILDRKIFDNGIISNIKEAIDYVSRHINVRFEIKEARRKEIPQYPLEAYREAIVNAVMHRDYFEKSGDVAVEVFRNKIIISNPGGLVKWLKEEDFGKFSRPRNQLIAELLSKTEYAEKMGTGIKRIRSAMKALGLPKPVFEHTTTFATILRDETEGEGVKDLENEGLSEGLNEGLKSLLLLITKNPGIKAKETSILLGNRPIKTIERQIKSLIEKKIIERRGSRKTGGYWRILEK